MPSLTYARKLVKLSSVTSSQWQSAAFCPNIYSVSDKSGTATSSTIWRIPSDTSGSTMSGRNWSTRATPLFSWQTSVFRSLTSSPAKTRRNSLPRQGVNNGPLNWGIIVDVALAIAIINSPTVHKVLNFYPL